MRNIVGNIDNRKTKGMDVEFKKTHCMPATYFFI